MKTYFSTNIYIEEWFFLIPLSKLQTNGMTTGGNGSADFCSIFWEGETLGLVVGWVNEFREQ